MKKRSFLIGFLSGAVLVAILVVLYSGIQSVLDLTKEQGLGLTPPVEYESLDGKFEDILQKLNRS